MDAPAALMQEDALARPWQRLGSRLRNAPWARIEILLALLLVVTTIIAYVLIGGRAGTTVVEPSRTLLWLVIAAGLLVLVLAVAVIRRMLELIRNQRRGIAGSRLHLRMMSIFAVLAIVPTLLVAFFALVLFEFGFAFWFSDNVRSILGNADRVARAYVMENRERIRGDVLALRSDLKPSLARAGSIDFQIELEREVNRRNLDEAVIFRWSKDRSYLEFVAEVRFKEGILQERLRPSDVAEAGNGALVVLSGEADEKDNIIQALVRFDGSSGYFLYVNRRASAEVLRQVASTRDALAQYKLLNTQRRSTLIRFMGLLGILSMFVLLIAARAALYSADKLAGPIGGLIDASNRVGEGDLSAQVPEQAQADELAMLGRSFNRMTEQLQQQRSALVAANDQLEARRRFTEAVLSGVSAGVLGLAAEGIITLPNESAAQLLGLAEDELLGKPLAQIAPEMIPLFEQCRLHGASPAVGPVMMVNRHGQQRTFMVQVTAESRGAAATRGFVVTFDDVTEALSNQRRAAWSDVARRIAHEIRNPLTPIMLSAERLRRKYGREIRNEPQVFEACIETITRQVGDLRRMVDEFSAFARMPKPLFREESLGEIVRESIFLIELANPLIAFRFAPPDAPVTLLCDRQQMAQAIINLLKNAAESLHARIEKSDASFEPWIEISLSGRDKSIIQLILADNGIGLPAEKAGQLFEPYVTTRERGTGLGLAIVKKIIEDHQGTLTLDNRPGGGAIATIRIDAAALSRAMSEAEAKEQQRHGH